MARRSGRGSKRRAPVRHAVASPVSMLPPLPRSVSSSSSSALSREQSDDSMDDVLPPVPLINTNIPPSPLPATGVRLVRTRSASSFTSTKSQAIAPPAFLKVLHDANAPVIGVDVDGIVTLWNKKVETITGFTAAEVVGQPLQEYIVGASRRDAVERSIHLAFQDRTSTLEVNIPLRTVSGRNATIVTSVTPLLSEDGTPLGVYGIGQDITEHRIHEAHYANVIMQANVPIIELDQDANITVWNTKAASLTGFTDVVGGPLLPMVDSVFRCEVSRQIRHSLTGVAGSEFELPLITLSGSRVEISVCLTPRIDASGDVVGVVAIGQDVTERNAKEKEYRNFIDSANAPIFGVDLCGSVVIFNNKAAEASEYSGDEIMGKNLIDTLISEEYRETVAAVFQKAFEGVQTANIEFPLVTKSGRKIEILLNATPRYDHLGKLCGAIGIGQDITDRIIQEQEYSRLIDTANAPIFGVDREFDVIIWNKKAANVTEYSSEEMMGEDILPFIAPEHRNAVQEVLKKALNGTETANFEFSLATKNGRRLDILLNATPKYDHFGNVCGVVGIGQDISDRRTQEQEYSRLIDTANAPIFGVDKEGRVNIWNRKAAQITEYSVFDVLGANLVENFIPLEYKKEVGAVLSSALEGVETANFEFPLITRTGRRVEILLNATPRHDEKGTIIGVVGIGQDITVRIAQEQEYSRLIDTANAPIFGVDLKGSINIWNKKAAEITQFSTEEVKGHDLVNGFVSDENRAAVSFALRKALQGAQTANFDFPLITKTGRRVDILLNATPRYNELGNIVGVVGIGQDITERIAQEQEYTRMIDSANAPIFGVNEDGRVNIWNKKAAEITQYTQSDVMGENLVEKFITEDYRDAVGYVLSKALSGIETANFEFPLMTKTGRRVEILLNATSRFNEHGKVIGMVGIGQDITERIAQEQEYSRLIDKANAPIFGVDVNGCVNIWNRKAAMITQYALDEVVGEHLLDKFISEDYRDAIAEVLARAMRGDESANFEVPLNTKTGRQVMFLLNATARFDQHGTIVGVLAIGQDITDRIAQEQEYTRLIDSANAPIFGVDVNGCVTIWNKKAAEITQYTSSDVMGENLVEKFITEDYREGVAQVLSKAMDGVETANFEFPLMTKTGRRVEILLNATSRFNEHGKVIGMVGIGQDITDRIAQEHEYSRLIDTANAPIFGVDANMCVNIWNKKAAQITNYSIHEVIGENLVETFISPEYRPLVSAVLSKALQGIQTANFEFPLITRPGTRIEILLNATPRMDSNGNIVGVVGIGQDITERIAQEHEYRRLIYTANAPIFGIDTDGCVNEWNQKIAEITGYSYSDVSGISLVNTLIIPESRKQVSQLLNQALIGIDVGEMELPMTTKNGVFLLLLVNASSKKDTHGNIRGVIGVGQDYTARKHMEAAKVNFLASFSHELRTPLNGVLGMLELLKEMKLDPVAERYVHIGYVSGSLLLNLINDILDLSKIEAGHMEISSAPFHMQDLLDYSIEIFNLRARERGLHLEQRCDEFVPKMVIGDVFRLRQVLLNLLSNAVKFTNAGSIVVSCSKVRSTNLPAGHVRLLFQVADTGIGMDKEEISRLFSLFTKLERTRQNNPTGSGLGLAICKQLVELMDGTIDVDSELGLGSNFYFTVVVQVVDEEDARKSSLFGSDDLVIPSAGLLPKSTSDEVLPSVKSNESNEGSGPLVVVPAKARILVVEDNDFNWEVLKCFLQEDDHFLQWEVNGRDAVNAYIQNHGVFDLIFMDCEMPVMDGYSATNMIRQFEQEKGLARIPILGLTAYAMNGDRQKCLDAGMDEFMVKPISKMTLRRAIRQWMKVRYLGAPQPSKSNVSTKSVASAPSPSSAERPRVSNTPLRDSFVDGVPTYPSQVSRESLDGVDEEIRSLLLTPPKSARLAPASQHMQQLDLTRALANLELDDPLAMNRRGGRSVRTGVPSTSIFSLGTPMSSNHTRSSSGSLLTFQRDASGAIVEVPEWTEPKDKTSNTLPTGKSSPLYHPDLTDQITVKRASYPKTPMIWTQQTAMKPPTSPITVKAQARIRREDLRRASGSITDEDQEDGENDEDHDQYSAMPPLSLTAGANTLPTRHRATTDSVSSMSPMDIEIPEGDPVNYALGVEQCGDREELFLDLLEKFSMGCGAAMDRIDDAYNRKDLRLLKREAHSLKGSSAYVAALRVSKSAYRVQLASERLMDNADNASLQAMVDSTMAALRKEHRLLHGYIRRNFAFRSVKGSSARDDRSREKPANACVVM